MRVIRVNRSLSSEVFYAEMVGVGPRNSVLLSLDDSYHTNGFTFKNLSVDIDSGGTIVGDMPGVLSDEFLVDRFDIPRLQEYHCLVAWARRPEKEKK